MKLYIAAQTLFLVHAYQDFKEVDVENAGVCGSAKEFLKDYNNQVFQDPYNFPCENYRGIYFTSRGKGKPLARIHCKLPKLTGLKTESMRICQRIKLTFCRSAKRSDLVFNPV